MIVRSLASGETALIGHTDHSRLVGQLAAHWGNARFAAPTPYDSVVRAATYHDFGWLDYETRPLIDPATGRPYQFRELPFSPEQLAAYGRWIDWLSAIDPYAGLLVSRHRTGLWQNRYDTIAHPSMGYTPQRLRSEIAAFIREREAAQASLLRDYDPLQFRVNYHLLQVWDLLGLYLCYGAPRVEYVEPVPCEYGDQGQTVRLELTPVDTTTVRLEPYPFDTRPLQVQIAYKALPQATYPSLAAFREAYFQAAQRLLTYTLT